MTPPTWVHVGDVYKSSKALPLNSADMSYNFTGAHVDVGALETGQKC